MVVALAIALASSAPASAAVLAPGRSVQVPGGGRDVSAAEFRQLAAAAARDPSAIDTLRAVRSVDGRPVDVDAALGGASGRTLSARLRTLAAGAGAGPVTGSGVPTGAPADRRAAARILDRDRYQPPRLPRPFRGTLRWLGDRLEPVFGPVGRFLAALVKNPIGAVALGALVAGAAAGLAWLSIGRRTRAAVERRQEAARDQRVDDPDELDRLAGEAEAAGRLDEALRLRFRAGLLRLDRAGALHYRPDATSGELVTTLGSAAFTGLAATFDEVVYGERPAQASDLESARVGWPRVLAEAGRQ